MMRISQALPEGRAAAIDAARDAVYSAVMDRVSATTPSPPSGAPYRYVIQGVKSLIGAKMPPTPPQRAALLDYLSAGLMGAVHESETLAEAMRAITQLLATQVGPQSAFYSVYTPSADTFFDLVDRLFVQRGGDRTPAGSATALRTTRMLSLLSGFWADAAAVSHRATGSLLRITNPRHSQVAACMLSMLPARHVSPEQLQRIVSMARLRLPKTSSGPLAVFFVRLLRAEASPPSAAASPPLASLFDNRDAVYRWVDSRLLAEPITSDLARVVTHLARLELAKTGEMTYLNYKLCRAQHGQEKWLWIIAREVLRLSGTLRPPADDGGDSDDDEDEAGEAQDDAPPASPSGAAEADVAADLGGFPQQFASLAFPACRLFLLTAPKGGKHAAATLRLLLQADPALLPDAIAAVRSSVEVNTAKLGNPPLLFKILTPFICTRGTPEQAAWLRGNLLRILDPSNNGATISLALHSAQFICCHQELFTPELEEWGLGIFTRLISLCEMKSHDMKDVPDSTLAHTSQCLVHALSDRGAELCCARIQEVIETKTATDDHASVLTTLADIAEACSDRSPSWGFQIAKTLAARTRHELEAKGTRSALAWPCTFLSSVLMESSGAALASGDTALLRECLALGHDILQQEGSRDAKRACLGGSLHCVAAISLYTHCGLGLSTRDCGPTSDPARSIEGCAIRWAHTPAPQADTARSLLLEAFHHYLGGAVERALAWDGEPGSAGAPEGSDLLQFSFYTNAYYGVLMWLRGRVGCALAGPVVELSIPRGAFDPSEVRVSLDEVRRAACSLSSPGVRVTDEHMTALVTSMHRSTSFFAEFAEVKPGLVCHRMAGMARGALPKGKFLRSAVCRSALRHPNLVYARLVPLLQPIAEEVQTLQRLAEISCRGTAQARTQSRTARSLDIVGKELPLHDMSAVAVSCIAAARAAPRDNAVLKAVLASLSRRHVVFRMWADPSALIEAVAFTIEAGHDTDEEEVKAPLLAFFKHFYWGAQPQVLAGGAASEGIFEKIMGATYKERAAGGGAGGAQQMCRARGARRCPAGDVHPTSSRGSSTTTRRSGSAAPRRSSHSSTSRGGGRTRCGRQPPRSAPSSGCAPPSPCTAAAAPLPGSAASPAPTSPSSRHACGRVCSPCSGTPCWSVSSACPPTLTEVNCANLFEMCAGLLKSMKRSGATPVSTALATSLLRQGKEASEQQVQTELCAALLFGARGVPHGAPETPTFLDGFVLSYLERCRGLQSLKLLHVATAYANGLSRRNPAQLRSLANLLLRVTERSSLLDYEACREKYALFIVACVTQAIDTPAEPGVFEMLSSGVFAEPLAEPAAELLLSVASALKGNRGVFAPFIPKAIAASVSLATERRA